MLLRNLAYFNLDWRSSRYRYKWCSFNNSEMSHSLWETDVWRVLIVEQDVKCVLDHYGCFLIKLGSLKVFRMWNWCALGKNQKKGVERKRAIEVIGNWLQRKMSPVSSCGQHFKHGHHSREGRLGKPSSLFRTLSIELNLKDSHEGINRGQEHWEHFFTVTRKPRDALQKWLPPRGYTSSPHLVLTTTVCNENSSHPQFQRTIKRD